MNSYKDSLKPFPVEVDYQAKVEEVKNQYVALDTAELARQFSRWKHEKQDLEDQISGINVHLEALSQMLVENLESSDMQNVKLVTGETAYIASTPYSSIDDKETCMSWFRKKKLTSMFTVVWASVNALNKERLAKGDTAIPGTKVFLKTSIRLLNGKGDSE